MNAVIIQARMGSTRLPGKILRPLAGVPSLCHVVRRCQESGVGVMVATTTEPKDGVVVSWCEELGVRYYCGDPQDVLGRYFQANQQIGADVVIRITADNPLIDWRLINLAIEKHSGERFLAFEGVPRGLEVELFTADMLDEAYHRADPSEREHVTTYMLKNNAVHLPVPEEYRSKQQLTIDTLADYQKIRRIYAELYSGSPIDSLKALRWIEQNASNG